MIKTVALLTLLYASSFQKGSASCTNPAGGILALGEILTLAGCNLGTCFEDGLYYLPCAGVILNDPECSTVPGDESKPYPACCPKISCSAVLPEGDYCIVAEKTLCCKNTHS